MLAMLCVLCLGIVAQELTAGLGYEGTHVQNGNNDREAPRTLTSGSCKKLSWTFEDETGTLTISGTGDMSDCSGSDSSWSQFAEQVEHIEIQEGVSSININAFREYSNLRTVNITSNLTSIETYAFYGCGNLTSITLL